jgi:hypothetical protein
MSRSNAAAINRRVNIPAAQFKPNTPVNPSASVTNPSTNNSQSQPAGFTLPQAISVIDNRLVVLEKFMRETQNKTTAFQDVPVQYTLQSEKTDVSIEFINQIIDEFNSRFSLFAQEISDMKDIVLKLQTYTMDVNKTLLEERIQVFSDFKTPLETDNNENSLINSNETISIPEDINTSIDIKNLIKEELSNPLEN